MMPTIRTRLLPLLTMLLIPLTGMAQISVNISVNTPPPELPVYDQPPLPEDGYVWTPGFWAWSDDIQDYYWVPGTWVAPPQPEFLWTPGYWGAEGGVFLWHTGYWGPHVGFYGGVDYGYGYGGRGYEGGYWQGGRLYYNRSVNNLNDVHVTNIYNRTVINNVTVNRVSYNGGSDGVRAQPTADQTAAARERHIEATSAQQQHDQAARGNPAARAHENNGRPPVAATPRPGAFSGPGVSAAKPGGMSVNHQDAPRQNSPRPPQSAPQMSVNPQNGAPQPRENAFPRHDPGQGARQDQQERPVRPTLQPPQERAPQEHRPPDRPPQERQQQQPQPQPQPRPQPEAHAAPPRPAPNNEPRRPEQGQQARPPAPAPQPAHAAPHPPERAPEH